MLPFSANNPAERPTSPVRELPATHLLNHTSARGLRQVLPVQTKSTHFSIKTLKTTGKKPNQLYFKKQNATYYNIHQFCWIKTFESVFL
jgi:hypothetical protein